jgi:hypothetical protein
VFQVRFAARVVSAVLDQDKDIKGNLMKSSAVNSAGEAVGGRGRFVPGLEKADDIEALRYGVCGVPFVGPAGRRVEALDNAADGGEGPGQVVHQLAAWRVIVGPENDRLAGERRQVGLVDDRA